MNLQNFIDKAKITGSKALEKGAELAGTTGKKATVLANTAKLNMQIFDINTEIEILYKEIGQLVFDKSNGLDINEEQIGTKIAIINEKTERIANLKSQIDVNKDTKKCPICDKDCKINDIFCASCGAQI